MNPHRSRGVHLVAALAIVVATACQPRPQAHSVTISGTEYSFAHPDSLAPGLTRFRFINVGHVAHEMSVGRLKPGVTFRDVDASDSTGGDVGALFERWGAILVAQPGDTVPASVELDLAPGSRIVLWCGFHDSAGAPPHGKLGMFANLTVRMR